MQCSPGLQEGAAWWDRDGVGWDGAGGGFHTENAHLEPKNQKDAGKL